MTDSPRVLAVDQGTGSTRAISVTHDGASQLEHQGALGLSSPRPGWVEQDPHELLDTVVTALRTAAARNPGAIVGIGLSNQRESALAWDAATGEPVGAMLGWQDRRTAGRASELSARVGDRVRELSGLPLDPMFSALKFEWLLDQIDPQRSRARRGELRVGTVDSWLLRRLTGEDRIEMGNASRTQLLNVRAGTWDDELLEVFGVPREALPELHASDVTSAPISGFGPALEGLRFHGVLGDSHAALFAHGVREPGSVKVTYGTGSSVMGLTAREVPADSGLVETIGWQRQDIARAFEGNILSTGGTLVWLGKLLGRTPAELAELALHADPHAAVDLVPAFAGLGAPWWDEKAHALIDGFDLGTGPAELALAALESIPLQIEDVLSQADRASGARITTVLADGGPARNDWLMQRQADLSDRHLLRPTETGLSALGAAHMAGLGSGFWSETELHNLPRSRAGFTPTAERAAMLARRERWAAAVARSRTY